MAICNGDLATSVSADKGSLERSLAFMSRVIPGHDAMCTLPFASILISLSLGSTTVPLRRLSKRREGVVDWVEFSNIGICIIRVSSDDPRLDTDGCSMSLDDSRGSTVETRPGGGAARASGGFAEVA
jgi:hypothetical protein